MVVWFRGGVRSIAFVWLMGGFAALAGAEQQTKSNPAADKLLPLQTLSAMSGKGVAHDAPLYIRIFKEESELEVWKQRGDGRFLHIKTFPICTWSGELGPKKTQGDMMAPEGFYGFSRGSLKPDSKYHLALNVGYPNALDRSLERTGNFIMVHGSCVSVGCFAMTDELIEEIYAFVREALDGGANRVPVHIFPFRMTAENLRRHAANPARDSWAPLKDAYDDFAQTYEPPRIGVCGKRYVVNPRAAIGSDPEAACPKRIGKLLAPISPSKAIGLLSINTPLVANGTKMKSPSPGTTIATVPAEQKTNRLAGGRDPDLGMLKPLTAEQ